MDDIEKALGNFEDMYIDDKDDIKKKQKKKSVFGYIKYKIYKWYNYLKRN